MEAHEYSTMFRFESSYWWYRGLHGALADLLRGLHLPPGARVLDAGCGTGGNLASLRRAGFSGACGFDFSPHAAPFWGERGITRACLASINEIPYAAGTFDAVMSVDVLESDAVDEAKAVSELWRVAKPGGYIVLVVPAYRWLLTEEHHKAVHASRRYTRREAWTAL
jgi:SAM-dependent methyltransferase